MEKFFKVCFRDVCSRKIVKINDSRKEIGLQQLEIRSRQRLQLAAVE